MAQFESWRLAMPPHTTPGSTEFENALEYAIEHMPYAQRRRRGACQAHEQQGLLPRIPLCPNSPAAVAGACITLGLAVTSGCRARLLLRGANPRGSLPSGTGIEESICCIASRAMGWHTPSSSPPIRGRATSKPSQSACPVVEIGGAGPSHLIENLKSDAPVADIPLTEAYPTNARITTSQ